MTTVTEHEAVVDALTDLLEQSRTSDREYRRKMFRFPRQMVIAAMTTRDGRLSESRAGTLILNAVKAGAITRRGNGSGTTFTTNEAHDADLAERLELSARADAAVARLVAMRFWTTTPYLRVYQDTDSKGVEHNYHHPRDVSLDLDGIERLLALIPEGTS